MANAMTRIETWDVLAGAYLGKSPRLDSCLTHAVEVDANGDPVRVLCGRVKLENLCQQIPEGDPITCKTCAKRAAK